MSAGTGMRVAVASGKGGTGKTTVAVALARSADGDVDLIDCDVEAPNAHLFYEPPQSGCAEPFGIQRPVIDAETCTRCGACVDFCAFGALALAGEHVLVFDELCHACGGCAIVCPVDAITERPSPIGAIHEASVGARHYVYGELAIGETVAPPLIRAVMSRGRRGADHIIDSPPGTTCPMVAAVTDADFVLLVTENTPFGVHDLASAVEVVRAMGLPHGVVINRSDIGSPSDRGAAAYCRAQGLPILLEIPFDPAIAEHYAVGESLLDIGPPYREMFASLWESVRTAVEHSRSPV